MLRPRKTKYRKTQNGRSLDREITTRNVELVYGDVGLKSLEAKFVYDKQIEACIAELKRRLGKKGRFWLRIFPHKSKTKKPLESRMGGGKGDVENYVALVRPGTMIFEVSGLDKEVLKNALKAVSYKLPLKTKIIVK